MTDSFPRQYARTQRLTLGEPRNVVVSPDGRRVVFAAERSGRRSGQLPVGARRRDRRGAARRRSAGAPRRARDEASCPPRSGPGASGHGRGPVASSGTRPTADVRVSAFASAGRLFVAGLVTAGGPRADCQRTRVRPAARPDRPPASRMSAAGRCGSPSSTARAGCWPARTTGRRRGGRPSSSRPRRWAAIEGSGGRPTARPTGGAASTSRRSRAGTWLTRPNPAEPPTEVAYPAAGTANADVTLPVIGLDGGPGRAVEWDRDRSRTSSTCCGPTIGAAALHVQSRDQKRTRILAADPATGRTTVVGGTSRRRHGWSSSRAHRLGSATAPW